MTMDSMRVRSMPRPLGRRRPRSPRWRRVRWLLLVPVLAGLALLGFAWQVEARTAHAVYQLDDPRLPHHHVALVFGAGLNAAGGPSTVLYDRVATAVDLYRQQKVDKLLMTGDNGSVDHNEVAAMRSTAVGLGVPESDIVL